MKAKLQRSKLFERRVQPVPSGKLRHAFERLYPKASFVRDYDGERVNYIFFSWKGPLPDKQKMNDWLERRGWYVGYWSTSKDEDPRPGAREDATQLSVMIAPNYGRQMDLDGVRELFHVIPMKQYARVLRQGLKPKGVEQQLGRSYRERVYLFTDVQVAQRAAEQWTDNTIRQREAFRGDRPTILRIDVKQLHPGTKFYYDPEFVPQWSTREVAVYTYTDIPARAVSPALFWGRPYHELKENQMSSESRRPKINGILAEARLVEARIELIQPGTKVRMRREPIYASSGTGQGRETTKVVEKIKPIEGQTAVVLRFKGVKHRDYNILKSFRGVVVDGVLSSVHGDKARFEVLGIFR